MCSFDGVKEDEEKSGLYSADHLEMRGLFSWFPTQKRPENRLKQDRVPLFHLLPAHDIILRKQLQE